MKPRHGEVEMAEEHEERLPQRGDPQQERRARSIDLMLVAELKPSSVTAP